MIWLAIGLILGYGMGWNRKSDNVPKDLEKCNIERSQQEADIAYYKKLTKDLVEENKELRNKINAS
jgi:hypothetical protein